MCYICPCCGVDFSFSSLPDLRPHLISQHTNKTLLMLSLVVESIREQLVTQFCLPFVSHGLVRCVGFLSVTYLMFYFSLGSKTLAPVFCSSHSLSSDPCRLFLSLTCLDLAPSSTSLRLPQGPWRCTRFTLTLPDQPLSAVALQHSLEPFHRKPISKTGDQPGISV